jgi:RND superfamily putative drug exporter
MLLASALPALRLNDRVRDSGYEVNGSQSQRATTIDRQLFHGALKPKVAVSVVAPHASNAIVMRDAAIAASAVRKTSGVASVEEPELSANGHVALVPLTLDGSIAVAQTYVQGIQTSLDRAARSTRLAKLQLVGQAAVFDRYAVDARKSLQTSAAISFPVMLAVLLVAFLSVTAALLPLALSAVCVGVAFGALYLLSYLVELNVFVEDTVLVIGLGLSIDFSLFMLSRVREALKRGAADTGEAITEAMRTTGRAITVSGLTIAAALGGLFVTGVGTFASLAIGAMAATLLAVAAALTLMPAVLVLMGDRVERLPLRVAVSAAQSGAFWRRLADFVVRRRVALIVPLVLIMLILSVPIAGMQISWKTFSVLPTSDPVRQATDQVAHAFGTGYGTPAVVTAHASPVRLTAILEHQRGVKEIGPPQFGDRGWVRFFVTLDSQADSQTAASNVRRMRVSLRRTYGPNAVVSGPTAESIDLLDRVNARTPLVVLVVLLAEILVLTLIFAAPVIALKAALTTLLSVTAALGVMTFVFGDTSNIHFMVPLFLFVSVFGLSTDYEVFLISRIREHYQEGMSNTDALKEALVRSSRAITLAGLTMSVVCFAFAISPLVPLQELGIGLGLAVLLDVTIVRGLLVPATVALLGDMNWWRPRLRSRAHTVGRATEVKSY